MKHCYSTKSQVQPQREHTLSASLFIFLWKSKGLPWWLRGTESTRQCRTRGFDPWVQKIPWRRKWQPTPVFLPMKSDGLPEEPGGLQSRGCKEWDMTERLSIVQYVYVWDVISLLAHSLFHLIRNIWMSQELLSRWLWHGTNLTSPSKLKSFWVTQEKEKTKENNTCLALTMC